MALGLSSVKTPDYSSTNTATSDDDDATPGHSNGHRFLNNRVFPTGAFARVNKRKNFQPRNILPSEEDGEQHRLEDDEEEEDSSSRTISPSTVTTDGCDDECGSKQSSPGESASDKWYPKPESLRSRCSIVPGIRRALLKTNSGINCAGRDSDQQSAEQKHHHPHLVQDQHQQLPLDLSQSECRSSPPAPKSAATKTTITTIAAATSRSACVSNATVHESGPVSVAKRSDESTTSSSSRASVGLWRPHLVSGIAPWIDPSFLSETGAMASSKIDALHRSGAVDYTRYVKRFGSAAECGTGQCRDLNYREHFHCLDCNCRVFVKKEEMIRHFKWHKKRDESLQHGFMRYSPCDDCSRRFPACVHNRKQTHYHCLKRGCDKCYISTSDVQMHANYHRKDTAIIQEGFQRFRATEDCLTDFCPFQGQKTTHFHCRRNNCNFTFKNKADMEKHKSFHIKDEQLTRDGFKKFTKHDPCLFDDCRFSRVCNHIHCIRAGCNHVFHSSGQLYSHKRKHEKSESEPDASPGDSQSQIFEPPPAPVTETYPTGTTLTSVDGLPVFKRKRGRPPKNQVPEVPVTSNDNQSHPFSLPLGLSPFSLAAAINGAGLSANYGNNSSGSNSDGLIPVPMLPILQLFNLPTSPTSVYRDNTLSRTSPDTMESMSPDPDASGDGDSSKRLKLNSGVRAPAKDEPVPDGYVRFRFNEDCGYPCCGYREHQTHFHCMRKACGYSFCDKTRFSQHTARHERLDTLMGQEFQQFRSNVNCGYYNCSHSGGGGTGGGSPSNKASHFHCLKCDFVCTDTNRVVAHRRQHHKMDSINAAGFDKYTPSQDCSVDACTHNRKQTHYHCVKCHYAVLGLSQMSSHKYKHANE